MIETFQFELEIEDIHLIYFCWNKVLSEGNCKCKYDIVKVYTYVLYILKIPMQKWLSPFGSSWWFVIRETTLSLTVNVVLNVEGFFLKLLLLSRLIKYILKAIDRIYILMNFTKPNCLKFDFLNAIKCISPTLPFSHKRHGTFNK